MNSIKQLRKYLQEQCNYLEIMSREFEPESCTRLEAADIVEEARRQCSKFGFEDIQTEAGVMPPRDALVAVGKMLTWAREQKSETDWLSPPQIAKMLCVKPDKVLHWIHTGELQAVNVATQEGGRPQYMVTPAAFDLFKNRRTTQPPVKTKRARPAKSPMRVYV